VVGSEQMKSRLCRLHSQRRQLHCRQQKRITTDEFRILWFVESIAASPSASVYRE
jgi:hypothetical protein